LSLQKFNDNFGLPQIQFDGLIDGEDFLPEDSKTKDYEYKEIAYALTHSLKSIIKAVWISRFTKSANLESLNDLNDIQNMIKISREIDDGKIKISIDFNFSEDLDQSILSISSKRGVNIKINKQDSEIFTHKAVLSFS
jgi:hypothetical protein